MGLLKIGGLASGLDTESLIKQLIAVERKPMAVMEQRRETLTSKAGAWRDLNSRLLNLQSRIADLKNLGANLWDAKRATVSDQTVLTASASNTAQPGSYSVEVVNLARSTTWKGGLSAADPTADLGVAGMITVAGGPGNGKEFEVKATDSLNDIAATVNGNKELGFTASVVQVAPGDYRLVLNGQQGAANDFALTGTAAADLKLDAAQAEKVAAAANAQIKVNSVSIEVGENTARDAVPGVTLNLTKVGTTAITVANDQSKVIDAVKQFVDQYNSTMDFIEQQAKYDTKTKKAGTLFGEGMVTSVQFALSNRAMNPVGAVEAKFNALGMVGITSEKFAEGGTSSRKLRLDESKLREALTANPDAVRDLFTVNDGTSMGVAVRMEEWLSGYTKTGGLILNRAETLDQENTRIKERLAHFDEQILPLKEKRLRNQFIALEKAMSTFQSQGQWLSQQISSLDVGSARR